MGKTAKPATMLVMDQALFEHEAVKALQAKGHNVTFCDPEGYEVIIGPRCWRIEPGLGDTAALLEMVLKGVRAAKRGKK